MENERFRKWYNLQYLKMRQIAPLGSLVMLSFSIALSLFPYMEFRFEKYYLGVPVEWFMIPILWVAIMLVIFFVAHLYIRVFHMYRTERRAEVVYNPYQVYAIQPFQEMWFSHIYLPLMRGSIESVSDGPVKEELQKEYEMVSNWLDLGYIPKKDFPEHLKKYYISNIEGRL